jgi:predicted Fe-Mo cluster-binding NifX family protein
MKVAIPLWQGRISPVFDEASRLLVVHISNGTEICRQEESLLPHNPFERAQVLPKLGVDLLICGMVSQMQQAALDAAGIRIIPHICGTMEDVIAAYLDGRLENGAMRMPGCGCRKRLRQHRNRMKLQTEK